MTKRAEIAAGVRSRIAGNLTSAAAMAEAPSATLIAGTAALDLGVAAPSELSGVLTPESGPRPVAVSESSIGAGLSSEGHVEGTPTRSAMPPVAPPGLAAVAVPKAEPVAPTPSAPVRPWEKLSITLHPADFQILEAQTAHARAAGIRMRRGGNPSVFMRAALRNLEALRLTSPAVWSELVRSVTSSERS